MVGKKVAKSSREGQVMEGKGGEKRPATSLTAQRSHVAELCLCSLTSRRRTLQTKTAEKATAGAGRQLLAYQDLSTVNNGSSDAQAFGSATETHAAQKSLASIRLYLGSCNIYPMGKHIFCSFCSERSVNSRLPSIPTPPQDGFEKTNVFCAFSPV